MNIDLTKLITNIEEEIDINVDLEFNESKLQETSIKRLEKVTFSGFVTKLYNNDYQISGCLSGTMILPDDITLEEVEYKFSTQIEEEFSEFNENDEATNNEKIKTIQTVIVDITDFDEEQKNKLRGIIKFFSGDRANVKIAVREDGDVKPCGAILMDNKILNIFKELAGDINVELL